MVVVVPLSCTALGVPNKLPSECISVQVNIQCFHTGTYTDLTLIYTDLWPDNGRGSKAHFLDLKLCGVLKCVYLSLEISANCTESLLPENSRGPWPSDH